MSANFSDLLRYLIYFFSYSFGRFFLVGGLMFGAMYVVFKNQLQNRKIQNKEAGRDKFKMEIRQSIFTMISYGVVFLIIYFLGQNGWNQLYFEPQKFGIWYLIFSYFLLFIFHETWFYWLHRAIHHKSIFSKIHKFHHHSNNPSPFAAFSMHPIEALVETGYLLVFSFLFPIHPVVLMVESFLAMTFNMLWHSGYEIFPKNFNKWPFFKYFNSSTQHNFHHQRPVGGYSLFTNFWDKICKTENPQYAKYYEEMQGRL